MARTPKTTTVEPADAPETQVISSPTAEYIAGSTASPYWPGHRVLPQSIDDLERDVDSATKTYEQMGNDPILGGAVDELKIAVLEQGWRVVGAVKKPVKRKGEADSVAEAEYAESEEIREFIEWNLNSLTQRQVASFNTICWDMLSAIAFGHRIAEWTFAVADSGPYAGGEILSTIKVKNRRNYAFAMSATNDVVGIVARIAGKGHALRTGLVYDVKVLPNAISPNKFWIYTIGSVENDPRGTSQFRKCYAPWYEKQTLRPERLKYGAQFGGGKVIVTLGVNTPSTIKMANLDGTIEDTPSFIAAQRVVAELSNSRGAVFPPDCKVDFHMPTGDGNAIGTQIDACDREMVYALKKQIRQTMEAKHGSKADSQTAENIADKVTNWFRRGLAESFAPVIRALVMVRYGEEAAERYTPSVEFSASSTGDLAANLEAHTKGGYRYHESQFADIDAAIGAPERDPDWQQDEAEEAEKANEASEPNPNA